MIQWLKDWLLERRIAFALRRMLRSADSAEQMRFWWWYMSDLINLRSPGQVARMEKRMGSQQRKTALSS